MLDDVTRKILTVMWNINRDELSTIDVGYISHRSQRTEQQVKAAINELVKEGFVLWDRQTNMFKVLYSREDLKLKPITWRGWDL